MKNIPSQSLKTEFEAVKEAGRRYNACYASIEKKLKSEFQLDLDDYEEPCIYSIDPDFLEQFDKTLDGLYEKSEIEKTIQDLEMQLAELKKQHNQI